MTRKRALNAMGKVALALTGADLLLYLTLGRPLAASVADARARFGATRNDIRATEARVLRLEAAELSFPRNRIELDQFVEQHVPPRRRSYSRAVGLIQQLAGESSVQVDSVGYRPEARRKHQGPLERLGIIVDAEGPFGSLLRFTHAIETTDDLVVVRGISLSPIGDGSALQLKLAMDLYITP